MIICSNCRNSNENTGAYCGRCGSKLVQVVQRNAPRSFVTITSDGAVSVQAGSIPEAKLALKELKLKKKELSLLKKQVTEQERQIRSAYTNQVRQRGSKFQGGGGVGRLIRSVQTASRDGARRELAQQLAPLEQQKSKIEGMRSAIEQLVLQLEAAILNNS